MNPSENVSPSSESDERVKGREWFYILILCFVNILNYMDRFTSAGILHDIQEYYEIGDRRGGLLQTFFMVAYMSFGPVFGYFGDRYSRKCILVGGVALWTSATLLGSFMKNYWLFACTRALVGVGESAFLTIAPTIIGDYFVSHVRTRMLTLFYIAAPVGAGLGYIVGAEAAKLFNAWQWGLRVTPIFGLAAVIIIIFLLKVPHHSERAGANNIERTSLFDDIKMLSRNRSYVLSTGGFTCMSFVTGALAWWGPNFFILGSKLQAASREGKEEKLSTLFGATTMLSGLSGLFLGCCLSYIFRRKWPSADPVICAVGLIASFPFLIGVTFAVTYNIELSYAMMYFGQVGLLLNMAIVNDILLSVVVPLRTASAQGVQMFIIHAFGDAGSAYIIGLLSEVFQSYLKSKLPSEWVHFSALKYAFFINCSVEFIGGVFFLVNSCFIVEDIHKVKIAIQAPQ